MNRAELLHASTTDQILKTFYHVYNTLGSGFLEKVHENALFKALNKQGLLVERQKSIAVYSEGDLVG